VTFGEVGGLDERQFPLVYIHHFLS
jgi:hypothetical protein